MIRICIVEDDESIRQLLKLTLENFQYEIVDFDNGADAHEYLLNHKVDLAILDLMLPRMNGYEILKQMRQKKLNKETPVIILSAKDQEVDKIMGLDLGADDYMTKPFALEELEARIQVQLRKNQSLFDQDLCVEGMRLLSDQKTLQIENQMITLTRHEYKIMELLMQYPKRAFSKKEIYEYAWDDFFAADDKTVSVHVSNIRNKVKNRELIDTVWGIGFKLHQERE